MRESNIYSSAQEFLKDTYFLKYVLDEDKTYYKYWQDYLNEHPESYTSFEEAKNILLHLGDFKFLSENDKEQLKRNILNDISK